MYQDFFQHFENRLLQKVCFMLSDNGKVLVHISGASHVNQLLKDYMVQVNREYSKYVALTYH